MSQEPRFRALEDIERSYFPLIAAFTHAEHAIAEYRADRDHGDGGWGEQLCEVLESIVAIARD